MANITYSQRTYAKYIEVPVASTSVSVSCVDTSGNLIDCNYIRAEYLNISATSGVGFVSPDIGSASSFTSLTGTISTTTGNGAVGFCLTNRSSGSTSYEYVCLGSEKFRTITLKSYGANAVFALTYGVVKPISPIRLSDRNIYDTGS